MTDPFYPDLGEKREWDDNSKLCLLNTKRTSIKEYISFECKCLEMGTEYRCQNISYRDLTELPQDLIEKTAKHVEELDLTANRISFLIEYRNLKSLVLDHNLVSSHVKIADMPCLHTLWVNHNRIDNLSVFISTLAKKCPNLKYLSMMNNTAAPSYFNNGTFQQYIDYRYFVISRLSKLEVLDDKRIEKMERSEAERIYKPVRKRVKKKQKTGD